MRILFVCLGNICRSPTAEGVMRDLLEREGLEGRVEVDSAGTGGWHVGSPPDERATAAAGSRGIRLTGSARRLEPGDLEAFDLVVAMDRENLAAIRALAGGDEPVDHLVLLRDYDPDAGNPDVPDPYYGGEQGFEEVLDIVERSCRGLLETIDGR
jgi:protein-tyrosine phosphatase